MKKTLPFFIIMFLVGVFFHQFLLFGKLPIPSDTIVGLYYPFRDLYSNTNPNGLPYKNFLITDPVRQQYVWKYLAINQERQLQLPLWNPYEMAGTPLLANFQSSPYYPLNLILFILPFSVSWSLFIVLQPLLAGIFLFLYLKNLKLNQWAALSGSIVWIFSGFFIAWMEWGVIVHTVLWLPLILLSVDKGFIKKDLRWKLLFIFSMSSSLLAGHLQTFFYVTIFTVVYFIAKVFRSKEKYKIFGSFIFDTILVFLITFFQWFLALQFILHSNRSSDQSYMQQGWFIPWQNLIQFIAPDFFGNPSTLNYFGVWNYAEFIGYIGILPLILALYALFTRRDKKTLFFGVSLMISFLFSLPTFISSIPYILHIPFLSTAQPTRLLSISCFSLAVLTALGFDYFLKKRSKIWIPIAMLGIVFVACWIIVILNMFGVKPQDILVSRSNLKLPTIIFLASATILASLQLFKKRQFTNVFICAVLIVILVDLLRFGWKFTPFTNSEYLFPNTPVLEFLQKQKGVFRIATTDSRILPPNFSAMYGLQSIEGYDPLYLKNYAAFVAAMERGEPDITEPYGFNRIITPRNYSHKLYDLLNVKYVLSFDKLPEWKFEKVFSDGKIIIYRNKQVIPRTFFASVIEKWEDDSSEIQSLFDSNLSYNAVVEGYKSHRVLMANGNATISYYSENKVIIKTDNGGEGFLVLTDSYYPGWIAKIDGTLTKIYRTDFAFRGVVVPKGKHTVTFEIKPI